MTSQWYCCIKSQQYGPYPFEHLQHWVAEGRLQPDDHVCIVGQQQWTLVRNVPELVGPAASFPQGNYTQSPAASSEPGFSFEAAAPSYSTPRKSSQPKKKEQSFNWAGAIFAGVCALIGGSYQIFQTVQKQQQAVEQRAQEQRRQQQLYRTPKLPPFNAPPTFDADQFNQRNKKYRQPWQK